jgi:hypothetical protein
LICDERSLIERNFSLDLHACGATILLLRPARLAASRFNTCDLDRVPTTATRPLKVAALVERLSKYWVFPTAGTLSDTLRCLSVRPKRP